MWELDHKESRALKKWCFCTVMLEKTLYSPLDSKQIKLVNPIGNQSWIFIGRIDAEAEAPILWPPDAKYWPSGKDPDAGEDWRQEEKRTTEDEIIGWCHRLDGHEFEQTPWVVRGREVSSAAVLGSQRIGQNWVTELKWNTARLHDTNLQDPLYFYIQVAKIWKIKFLKGAIF